jgi:hypothetical protein
MKKKPLLFPALAIFALVQITCQKDKNQAPKPVAKIDVSAITMTDPYGNPMWLKDSTDWREDENWTEEEISLFDTPDTMHTRNAKTGTVTVYPAYPNPLHREFGLSIRTSTATVMQLVFADSLLAVKNRYVLPVDSGSKSFRFRLDTSLFAAGTNYRLYYGFYSRTDPLYYKGHGDLKLN